MAYTDTKHITDVVAEDESCTSRNGTTIRSRTYLHQWAAVLVARSLYLTNLEAAQ